MDTLFRSWGKTPRLYRDITITEKIDGTNSCVIILPDEGDESLHDEWGYVTHVQVGDDTYAVAAQSRKRLIKPDQDNFEFAAWVWGNAQVLAEILGPGYHFGEWWGKGIQRNYGATERYFSLFEVGKVPFGGHAQLPNLGTVPLLYEGRFDEDEIRASLARLRNQGSIAGWWVNGAVQVEAEGICVRHSQSGHTYKVMLEHDDLPKSRVEAA